MRERAVGARISLAVCLLACSECEAALVVPARVAGRRAAPPRGRAVRCSENEKPDVDGGTKAVWFATELFGKVAAAVKGPPPPPTPVTPPPRDLDDAIARLASDYEGTPADPRPYFLTGEMDVGLYDEDCEFADPFVSFNGRQRFVDNLQNLAGGFITESSTKTLETSLQPGDVSRGVPPAYTTKLMVKLRLGLPWSPVLAWPWGVTHEFDPQTGLIVRHVESWDVSPAEGVRQLFAGGADKRV